MKRALRNSTRWFFLLSTFLLTTVPAGAASLYFPYVETRDAWQTEIGIINTSATQSVTGTLRALGGTGQQIGSRPVTLAARGRMQILAGEFTNPTAIRYLVLDTASSTVEGYAKFFVQGSYRAAVPAVKEVNGGDIPIPHIDAEWWTTISLVNTTAAEKTVTITFNNGQVRTVALPATGHQAFTIGSLFGNQPQPDIHSAVMTNASGVVGLELFGTQDNTQLEGILLTDRTSSTLYYPHVDNNGWWTGIVAYNPSTRDSTITITPYDINRTALPSITETIQGGGSYVRAVSQILPSQTVWFKIVSSQPLAGFELFGTTGGNRLLGSYAGSGAGGSTAGIFAKIETQGWTGIAFVNPDDNAASVTLTAYADSGAAVATRPLTLNGHEKMVDQAGSLFSPQDISGATYIGYSASKNIVGFQLNASNDGTMLDGLPILGYTESISEAGPLYAGFTGAGLYAWDGASWTQINPGIPASMVASGSTLHAAFAGSGLYAWNGASWNQLSPTVPENMAVSDTTVYAAFTGSGLYAWNGASWTQINPSLPARMMISGSTLYAAFAGSGLYAWNGTAWTQLSPTVPENMAVSGTAVYASFAGSGLYARDGAAWTQINPSLPTSMTVSGSTLYAAFAGSGLYAWNGASWTQLSPTVPENMAVSGSAVYAAFAGSGLYAWDGAAWTQINPSLPASLLASGPTLYATFAGAGLYAWNGTSWTQISPNVPENMAAVR